eukprot:c14979_g1_i3.p1 GENE.c14979_g1_i3~~c14979_g1_i3.p1  ORF type:complete len:198 (+),score=33.14 c14979_g1_i3:530-1123(+)
MCNNHNLFSCRTEEATDPDNDAETQIGANLIAAASGVRSTGDKDVDSVLHSLRATFARAREQLDNEQEAVRKIAAALGGNVEFTDLDDGSMRMKVSYKVSSRKVNEECVTNLPPVLLAAVLSHVAQDPSPTSKANLDPRSMAMVSPRMFWGVVRHGAVGPERSFVDALKFLTPAIPWEQLLKRESKRPERYANYVPH